MSELLDTEVLNQLREIMEDDFGMLLETFLVESEKQYFEAAQAWEDQNMDTLARSIHSLKGSCGNIGAHGLQQNCQSIELLARGEDHIEIPALLQTVESDLKKVVAEVSALQ